MSATRTPTAGESEAQGGTSPAVGRPVSSTAGSPNQLVPGADTSLRSAEHRRLLVAATAIVVLCIGDIVSTKLVLGAGGAEGNPIAEALMSPAFWAAKVAIAGLFGLRAWTKPSLDLLCIGWFLAGFYALTVLMNVLAYLTLTGAIQ